MRIDDLFWDDNNLDHLWRSHRVTVDEIEEIIFGIEGAPATYRVRRDGNAYVLYGETSAGRLLKVVGSFLRPRVMRIFGAIDMNNAERRAYRQGKS